MDSKTSRAITDIVGGMQALRLGLELTTALIGVMKANRPELAGLTDAEIIARYQAASAAEHQAVLAEQQRIDRETQTAAIVPQQAGA